MLRVRRGIEEGIGVCRGLEVVFNSRGKCADILHRLQGVSYVTAVCSRIVILSVYLGTVLPYERNFNSMICTHSGVVVHHSRISLEDRVMFNGSLFGFSVFNCMFNFSCGRSGVY